MTDRVFNFSAGPAVLPVSVLEQAQRDLLGLPGVGISVLEMSHRSAPFEAIIESAEANLRRLLNIPSNYRVLFLQGGSRLQFSMIPMNLAADGQRTPNYILTGSWGKNALQEAVKQGDVHVAWDGKSHNYNCLPDAEDIDYSDNAAYVHFTSNETIQGVQFNSEPETNGIPLVCDASSDFLCRPLPVERYGMIYACAQKNAGPAGVTVVIIREDLLARGPDNLPGYLNYRSHNDNQSMWNTPPTFAIYILDLVTRWLLDDIGGLDHMLEINRRKSQMLYQVIDDCEGFYDGHADRESRSLMNVTFRLPSDELQKAFLEQAAERKLCELKGHRSVGGIRASIYNAMPVEGVESLAEHMRQFSTANR